ncbi:hypothetical protein DL1_12400 [Thioclava dalianensis]|uniref:Flagella basal body P-ring formation protein FlgA n=1 Tax=Thioclava dalianensis TaxID=1185766 RepID=A0A074U104_9RHOB|nr:flagellar basal body P-ring formation chaperone FlgA [Thioclava dalianensis]KEP68342.1 hypothetical protein DL1_12400 [Thioclava dalianensis]SFN82858.1 flagella basal body P-ring formation protein FlgA [Thioclava dalianensis]
MMRREAFLIGALAMFGSSAAGATTLEPAAAIETAIRSQLHGKSAQIMANGGAMMPACQTALSVKWLPSGSDDFRTAAVSCAAPSWTIYAGVKIATQQTALIATRAIAAGGVIDTTDTAMAKVAGASLHGTALSDDALTDAPRTTRAIAAGAPITREMTDLTTVMQAGETATVQVNLAGLSVTATGKVLQDGAVGDAIAVENAATHRRLTATIVRRAPARPGTFVLVPQH